MSPVLDGAAMMSNEATQKHPLPGAAAAIMTPGPSHFLKAGRYLQHRFRHHGGKRGALAWGKAWFSRPHHKERVTANTQAYRESHNPAPGRCARAAARPGRAGPAGFDPPAFPPAHGGAAQQLASRGAGCPPSLISGPRLCGLGRRLRARRTWGREGTGMVRTGGSARRTSSGSRALPPGARRP